MILTEEQRIKRNNASKKHYASLTPEQRRNRYKDPHYVKKYLEVNKERIKKYDTVYRQGKREYFTLRDYKRQLIKRYGINYESYQEILMTQNNSCAICGAPHVDEVRKRLHVDHCHVTGKIRGLLCNGCNKGIGNFKDRIESMQKAIEYLKRNQQ